MTRQNQNPLQNIQILRQLVSTVFLIVAENKSKISVARDEIWTFLFRVKGTGYLKQKNLTFSLFSHAKGYQEKG